MEPSSTKRIRILHVDDEPDFGELTAEYLMRESESFEVETATSASEGLEMFDDSKFDCVVSDYDMPGKNGIEFLEDVRERFPEFPFILYTGKGSEEIASEAITAGVDDYLQKARGSDRYVLLANRISNAVEKYQSSQEAARTRRFFSTLIERSTDVIPVIDPDGTITFISSSCEPILGYEPDELVGERAFDYIHPDDVDAAGERFFETIEDPSKMPEVDFRFRHADGSWVQLHGRAQNLLDDPDVSGIVSYNRLVDT